MDGHMGAVTRGNRRGRKWEVVGIVGYIKVLLTLSAFAKMLVSDNMTQKRVYQNQYLR